VALDDPADVRRLRQVDAIADTVYGKVLNGLLDKVRHGGVVGTVLDAPLGAEEQGLRVHAILTHRDPQQLTALGEAVVKGELMLPVDRRFPLHEVRIAQDLAEAGGVGKVLLVPI
jgi:NADPH:quinone reductase-like Zn-dependent oxidoreductase